MTEVFYVEELDPIQNLFHEKGWEIDNTDSYGSFFNRFCRRYSLIKNNECKNLFLDLSKRFFKMETSKDNILSKLFEMFNKIAPEVELFKKIYLTPLKRYSPETKSADGIWNCVKYNKSRLSGLSFFHKIELKSLEDLKLKRKMISRPSEYLIILVDDFVGSGNTVKDVLKDLYENKVLSGDNYIYVFSLAGMEEGAAYLSKNVKVDFLINEQLKKGLSSRYENENLNKKMTLIQEATLKDISYKGKHPFLGYKNSESLYSFGDRAANNTFPIFWFEKSTRNGNTEINHYAPFNRK